MAIVKKNILSILCGVVVLAAIIATWYPMGGYFEKLQTDVNKRFGREQQLTTLARKHRELPILGAGSAAVPLTTFPNTATVNRVKDIIKTSLVNQANELADDALKYNQPGHVLMTPNSLPKPTDPSRFEFQDTDAAKLKSLREDVLNGTMPPSDAEIQAAIAQLRTEADKQLQKVNDQIVNQAAVDLQFKQESAKIPQKMRMDRATQHKMYVFPEALAVDPIIGDKTKPPTADQIWYAQVGYWVQQDVATAIARTNAKATNVIEAPVKALVRFDVPVSSALYVLPLPEGASGGYGARRGMGGEAAVTTAGDPYAPIKRDTMLSPTGRVCNPLYDVVQFTLVANIDARQMEVFLRNLSAGQFITVKQVNLTKMDLDAENSATPGGGGGFNAGYRGGAGGNTEATAGFIYGSDVPLARVEVQCEELFLRSWTEPWMPEQVKIELGIVTGNVNPVGPMPPRGGYRR